MNQPLASCNIQHQLLAFEAELSRRRQAVGAPGVCSIPNPDPPRSDEPPLVARCPPSPPEPNPQDIPMEVDDPWRAYSSIDQASGSYHVEEYAGSAKIYCQGQTFMDKFDKDRYALERQENLYYPFASREEWQFAEFLLQSGLSMNAIDRFLKLDLVSHRL